MLLCDEGRHELRGLNTIVARNLRVGLHNEGHPCTGDFNIIPLGILHSRRVHIVDGLGVCVVAKDGILLFPCGVDGNDVHSTHTPNELTLEFLCLTDFAESHEGG